MALTVSKICRRTVFYESKPTVIHTPSSPGTKGMRIKVWITIAEKGGYRVGGFWNPNAILITQLPPNFLYSKYNNKSKYEHHR
jgi:hypothetical protein